MTRLCRSRSGTKRAQAKARHGRIDPGRIGESIVHNQEKGTDDLAVMSILERKEALRKIMKGIVPVELFEVLSLDVREQLGDEGDQLRDVALLEGFDDPGGGRQSLGGLQASELGHIIDHRPLLAKRIGLQEVKNRGPVAAIGGPGLGMALPVHFGDDRGEQGFALVFGSRPAPWVADAGIGIEDGIAYDLVVLDGIIPGARVGAGLLVAPENLGGRAGLESGKGARGSVVNRRLGVLVTRLISSNGHDSFLCSTLILQPIVGEHGSACQRTESRAWWFDSIDNSPVGRQAPDETRSNDSSAEFSCNRGATR